MAKIAFIGLGHMGGGMAPNLSKAGHDVRAFDLSEEALARAADRGCTRCASAEEACKDADVIYAKSWGPLLTTTDKAEGKKLQDSYKDWIMDDAKLSVAKQDAIYMHPLPADRDIEVTSAILDGTNSVVFDEAENRLHAQKAVMALTMA